MTSIGLSTRMADETKVILLGDAGVGKTKLFCSFMDLPFPTEDVYLPCDNSSKQFVVGKLTLTITLFDTAGMEKLQSLTNSYYRGSVVALLVFNPCQLDTLNDLGTFIDKAKIMTQNTVTFFLVSYKKENTSHLEVTKDIIETYMAEKGIEKYFEITEGGKGDVHDMFLDIAEAIDRDRTSSYHSSMSRSSIHIEEGKPKQNRFKKCCS